MNETVNRFPIDLTSATPPTEMLDGEHVLMNRVHRVAASGQVVHVSLKDRPERIVENSPTYYLTMKQIVQHKRLPFCHEG